MSIRMRPRLFILTIAAVLCAQAALAQQSKTDAGMEFNPHWYGQIQGGGAYTLGETAFKDLLSPAAAVSLGYQFTPVVGLRVGAGGWQGKGAVVTPPELYKFNYVQGQADLVFNLANLIAGYDHKRVFSPFFLLGGGVAVGFNNGANNVKAVPPKTYFGHLWDGSVVIPAGRYGIGTDVRLGDGVALTLEVNGNILGDKFNSKRVDCPDYQFNALAGLKFALGKTTRTRAADIDDLAAKQAAEAAERAARQAAEKAEAERLAAERAARERAEAERLAAEAIAAGQTQDFGLREMNTFFKLDSDEITPDETVKLENFAAWLKANPAVKVYIAGYADRNTGTPSYNQLLSDRRAAVVKGFLIGKGISPARIVSVEGNGDKVQPFEKNELNRVVIISVGQ